MLDGFSTDDLQVITVFFEALEIISLTSTHDHRIIAIEYGIRIIQGERYEGQH